MNPNPPVTDSNQDLAGRTLGDYSLLRRLGRGGMADVYLARQGSLERNVALKILKPELAGDESYVKRFHREAQSAATLVQANIVQIYEVNKIDGLHFIAQEYVQGRNLRQYLDRHGAVEPVLAITVLRQCAMALQKAAEFNVIHRDIKPENIMLSTSGEVKVTDFGLARINNDSTRQALTQIGITMGTPLYMSPEQVEGAPLDSRSDIYSLGVTIYHMLAGHPPFEGENALSIAVQQVKDAARPLPEIRPDVPAELCAIIHRMIAKNPLDRPQDNAQLLKELRKVKIDMDEDWDDLIEKLAVSETGFFANSSTISQVKLAATQQLQLVMKGHVRSWWNSPAMLVGLVMFSLLGLLGGTLTATRTAPRFPLDVEQVALNDIPKKDDVREQYDAAYWGTYALGSGDDQRKADYWKAVLEYFPLDKAASQDLNKTKLYHRHAQSRLGEVYLSQSKFAEALEIYQALEATDDITEFFPMMGIAGQAIAYYRMPLTKFKGGKSEQVKNVKDCLSRIGPKRDLLNEFMRNAVEKIESEYSVQQTTIPIPTALNTDS